MLEAAPLSFSPSWTQAFKSSLRNSEQLNRYLGIKAAFSDEVYPVFVPLNLAQKIKELGPDSALWKQFVPDRRELSQNTDGLYDPIGDTAHSKGSGIIHRYKNRILFAPTTVCPVNCRYCFRKNELASQDQILKGRLEELSLYLEANPGVEEVILTGGDPLMVADSKLESIVNAIAGKTKYLRFHTRTPVIMPERVDTSFLKLMHRMSEKFTAVSIAIHANHDQEFDRINEAAIKALGMTGVRLLSQSVLLKGVNDSVDSLKMLLEKFAELNVRAYYLHHPDKVKGAMHFYLSLEEGRQIYSNLRDELPGWAIPHYVLDPENGQGKNLAYNPESIEYSGQLLDRFNRVHRLKR